MTHRGICTCIHKCVCICVSVFIIYNEWAFLSFQSPLVHTNQWNTVSHHLKIVHRQLQNTPFTTVTRLLREIFFLLRKADANTSCTVTLILLRSEYTNVCFCIWGSKNKWEMDVVGLELKKSSIFKTINPQWQLSCVVSPGWRLGVSLSGKARWHTARTGTRRWKGPLRTEPRVTSQTGSKMWPRAESGGGMGKIIQWEEEKQLI